MCRSAPGPGTGTGTGVTGIKCPVLVLLLLGLSWSVESVSEPGKWTVSVNSETLKQKSLFFFPKTLFNNTFIQLKVLAEDCSSPVQLNISWYLRSSHCYKEFFNLNDTVAETYYSYYSTSVQSGGGNGFYAFHQYQPISCQQNMNPTTLNVENFDPIIPLKEIDSKQTEVKDQSPPAEKVEDVPPPVKPVTEKKSEGSGRRRRDEPKDKSPSAEKGKDDPPHVKTEVKDKLPSAEKGKDVSPPVKTEVKDKSPSAEKGKDDPPHEKTEVKDKSPSAEKGKDVSPPVKGAGAVVLSPHVDAVAQSWDDGPYMFILHVSEVGAKSKKPSVEVAPWSLQFQVSMKGPHDYISATEWPLSVFYMVMCIVYVLMAVLWLLLSSCYWRDLLRIQFWIGGVIFLGMLEKAVYYAEFQRIQYDGMSVQGAVVFGELLSAVKRTLARVLVIIASLGYGIVKPRLGALLHRVVGVALLYLILSMVEGTLRVNTDRGDDGRTLILCDIFLAFIDSCVAWWIFVSLAQTMKLLRLRRNVVKLSLYRHFTNTLIFAVIASVIFSVWTSKTFRMSTCLPDWRELWINDAFWPFLFSIILMVIMFLWRPSANNQRYAFSPLFDEESDDDEEKEPMMNEAFEGMKMRGTKSDANGSTRANKADEDLKWVEENIPSSMADM
uniref:Transmembrane protein 87A-like n=1 Tax=Gouania willdenowi TaxID=441366 RepID=A0A8C5DVL1_GOUWI